MPSNLATAIEACRQALITALSTVSGLNHVGDLKPILDGKAPGAFVYLDGLPVYADEATGGEIRASVRFSVELDFDGLMHDRAMAEYLAVLPEVYHALWADRTLGGTCVRITEITDTGKPQFAEEKTPDGMCARRTLTKTIDVTCDLEDT
jgi:hypothetical protein